MNNLPTNNFEPHKHLLELMVSQTETYHNHKETMAHAGVLVQIALVAGLLSYNSPWPPTWVPTVTIYVSQQLFAALAFISIWLLIHVFVRWQLRNRRWAALSNAALVRTLQKWANTPPTCEELAPYKSQNTKKHSRLLIYLDSYLLPVSSALLHEDVAKENYPLDLVTEWKKQEKEGTGAFRAEWLLWLGSVLMLVLGLVRIYG
ncbi:MAG: hypothetical protein ABSH16_02930 [Sedimentisphaerales bacterium]